MAYWEQKIVQMHLMRYLVNSILCLFFLCSSCSPVAERQQLPYYNTADFTPLFIKPGVKADQRITHTISSFSFTDQNNQRVTEKNIEGKIQIANFIFTSCGNICPVMTKNMKPVAEAFRNDSNVLILSFSVTPWIDNVERLKKYTILNQITSRNWHFLTGNKTDIYKLARQSYFAEEELGFTKDSTDFLHTEHVLLVDSSKRIRGIYNGTLQLDIEQLIKDIKLLKGN